MLDAAVSYCCEMVDSDRPVTGFLLRMLNGCLFQATVAKHIANKAHLVAIVNKCGPSAASLCYLYQYAAFVCTVVEVNAAGHPTGDPKVALQLTMSTPMEPRDKACCTTILNAVRAFPNPDEELLLCAVAWLDFRAFLGPVSSGLVVYLAGTTEKVSRTVAASARIMSSMKQHQHLVDRIYLFEKLVFWWAQVQWQTNNMPTAKRMLDVKTTFVPGGMQFRPVEAPAPFPLDVSAAVDFVVSGPQTALSSNTIASIHNILRMVHEVAPKVILDKPAARLYIIENVVQLPELCAAIIVAGPQPQPTPVSPGAGTGAGTAAGTAATTGQ
jgi:hypothetical protein